MPILLGSSQRSVAMREAFTQWVDKVSSDPRFASRMVEELAVEAFGRQTLYAKTGTSKYDNMWAGYHSFSTGGKLVEMWSKVLESPSTESYFPLFIQFVTRKVMEEAVLVIFPKEEPQDVDTAQPTLKADDEQALRYVAGYVALVLKKKYEKRSDPKALKYVDCLSEMNENTDSESELPPFLEYTKLWIHKVNRGGLFKVNNDVFLLFRAMETAARRVLTISRVSANTTISIKEYTKTAILNDPAVLTHWNHILGHCSTMNSSESDDLLEEISEKWATIRGHSFASGWVELYQRAKKESNKQKSLRKGLQQQNPTEHVHVHS